MWIATAYGLLWLALLTYLVYPWIERHNRCWGAIGISSGAWICLTVGLVERSFMAGHWPLTNRYEFALCFVWASLGLHLLWEAGWRGRSSGFFVMAVALFVASYAVTRPETMKEIVPLLPALRSPWLQLHAATAVIAYAACGIAAGFGLAHLFTRRMPERLPPTADLERAMERSITLSFPWLTFSILAGAIWAQQAWARLWGWDPKEVWALLTWLWYLMVLHLCPLPHWRGRRMAVLVLIGFGLVMFTFIGVPWLVRLVRLESLHGF